LGFFLIVRFQSLFVYSPAPMISSLSSTPSGSFDLLFLSLLLNVQLIIYRGKIHTAPLYICKRPPMGFSESISYEKEDGKKN
jgi:hypothetical protein